MEQKKILIVDDDENLLFGYQRNLRKDFEIDVASNAKEGFDKILKDGPYAVIISDMRMPEMNGIEFLSVMNKTAPDSVRIMLTGNSDLETATKAVNEGNVFRYLTKPCPPEQMKSTITAAMRQYELLNTEKKLLKDTLTGFMRLFSELMSKASPIIFSRSIRVTNLVKQISAKMEIYDAWKIETASMLSQIGYITIPESLIKKAYSDTELTEQEQQIINKAPQMANDFLAAIPRIDEIKNIIKYQQKRYDGKGWPPDGLAKDKIPIGARILKLALDFDILSSIKESRAEVLEAIIVRQGWYDPKVLKQLRDVLIEKGKGSHIQTVYIDKLEENMVLAENIFDNNGLPVFPKGKQITEAVKAKILSVHEKVGIKEPIKIYKKA